MKTICQNPREHAERIVENYLSHGMGDPRDSTDHAVATAVAYLDLLHATTRDQMQQRKINEAHSRLLDFIRRHRPGCRILSEGDRCTCLLCDVDLLAFHARSEIAEGMDCVKQIAIPQWYTWEQVNRDVFDGDIWWWDDGDQIFPVNIAYSPTSKTFFATLGQWGWNRSQELSEMGGLWTPCVAPERQTEEGKP